MFETIVFGGPMDEEMRRYATWDEAVEGHDEMVKAAELAYETGVRPESKPVVRNRGRRTWQDRVLDDEDDLN